MSEEAGVVVVSLPGRSADPSDLVSFAKFRLADFEVPQHVVVRSDPLPRNPGGRTLKAAIRDQPDWGKQL